MSPISTGTSTAGTTADDALLLVLLLSLGAGDATVEIVVVVGERTGVSVVGALGRRMGAHVLGALVDATVGGRTDASVGTGDKRTGLSVVVGALAAGRTGAFVGAFSGAFAGGRTGASVVAVGVAVIGRCLVGDGAFVETVRGEVRI
jgi:hypothetical protein